ncbi:MAG: DUF1934 domain-containing protein [Eubacterium sp.]|nr:DUF1934 domain-containing protein [Eubacterium sp.]
MNKNALIKIVGRQKYGRDRDKIEMTTVGTIEEKDDCFILRYKEEQEPPMESLNTKLTIKKDESSVELMRTGKHGSLLLIERSKRNLCNYATGVGDILMGIYGKNIENSFDNGEGSFFFSYDIDVNGALTSENEVRVDVKIN